MVAEIKSGVPSDDLHPQMFTFGSAKDVMTACPIEDLAPTIADMKSDQMTRFKAFQDLSLEIPQPEFAVEPTKARITGRNFPSKPLIGDLDLYCMPGGRIIGEGVVVSNKNLIITESAWYLQLGYNGKIPTPTDTFWGVRADDPHEYINDIVLFCGYHLRDMYSHFLVFTILIIILYRKLVPKTDLVIVYPGFFKVRLREMMSLIECDYDIREHTKSFAAKKLVYMRLSYMDWNFIKLIYACRDSINDVVARAYARVPLKNNANADRIYIMRGQNAPRRRLLNEQILIERLKKIGFYILDCGKEPFPDAIAKIGRARLIVSPHGASALNVLFGSAGSTYVEIVPSKFFSVAHSKEILMAARARSMNCGVSMSADVVSNQMYPERDFHCDGLADIDELLRLIKSIDC
ncbi:glycosyltransferase family 61 protein [uncultured Rhodoblastus sp.]|uniref:glycosyltransferase 61 family protein n=1 Tax=uncultured Rhodoblastus sp. TaxID=543037 RepID=UPI0025DBED21|nr:glycosyltransferase family 61 protein [uncultured Rhodoblastus sp.]